MTLSTNPRNGYGNENDRGFCKYFHGENRKRHYQQEQNQIASLEEICGTQTKTISRNLLQGQTTTTIQ